MKAVHFGAGSIGRGFIGDLLHSSGYEVTFVDVNDEIINQINRDGGYSLYRIEEGFKKVFIDKCRAVSSVSDLDGAVQAIAESDIITTSVLAGNLPRIAPVLLAGLKKRYELGARRVNVHACENAVGNSELLRGYVAELDEDFAKHLDQVAAFANTEVDRMVLASERDGEKTIDIGKDFELAIDRRQLANPEAREIAGADYTDNLAKYIERKLFIINGGHVWAGLMAHRMGYTTMQEFFGQPHLVQCAEEAMMESGRLIMAKYGFTEDEIVAYIKFAMGRFCTPGIVDTVARVCRSPIRKLQAHERLVYPAIQCAERGIPCPRLLQGIAAAFLFDLPDDAESVELVSYVDSHGVEDAVTHFTGIAPDSPLFAEIVENYRRLKAGELSL